MSKDGSRNPQIDLRIVPDDGYRLKHRARDEIATLAVRGATYRAHIPPAKETTTSFANAESALHAMNATLERLMAEGWELEGLLEKTEQQEPDTEPEADELEEADPRLSDSSRR